MNTILMKFNVKKFFMLILMFSMLISMYVFSFFESLPIIYIIYMIFSIYFIFQLLKEKRLVDLKPLFVVFSLLFISLIAFLLSVDSKISLNTLINGGKLFVWGIILSFSVSYLKKDVLLKIYTFIAIFTTIYLFVQAFFSYILSINLSNVFDFGIITFRTVDMGTLIRGYRPSSFFAEPIDYSNFILCYLGILLLGDYKIKYKKPVIIFLIIGMLLAASTTGIFMLLLLIGIYVLKNFKKNKKMILTSILILPVILLIFSNLNSILINLGTVGETILKNIEKVQYASTSSRIGGSYSHLKNLKGINLYIGYGVGNEYVIFNGEASYMNTITRIIFQFGVIGLAIIGIYLIKKFFKTENLAARFIILLTIIECFTSNILFSISNIFMLLMAYILDNERMVQE